MTVPILCSWIPVRIGEVLVLVLVVLDLLYQEATELVTPHRRRRRMTLIGLCWKIVMETKSPPVLLPMALLGVLKRFMDSNMVVMVPVVPGASNNDKDCDVHMANSGYASLLR